MLKLAALEPNIQHRLRGHVKNDVVAIRLLGFQQPHCAEHSGHSRSKSSLIDSWVFYKTCVFQAEATLRYVHLSLLAQSVLLDTPVLQHLHHRRFEGEISMCNHQKCNQMRENIKLQPSPNGAQPSCKLHKLLTRS